MRKKMMYLAFAFMLALPTLFFQTKPASASSTQELPFNTTVAGTISDSTPEQVYKVTLPKAGTLSVQLKSYLSSAFLDLTTSDGSAIWDSENIYDGSPNNPKDWSGSVDLEAGTYYLKVYQAYQDTGKYDLSVKYDQAPNNETEPNNGTLQAQEMPFNTQNVQNLTGFISWNDSADYYKLILPKAGTISVNLESYLNSVYLDLTTSDGQSIWDGEYINDGSPNNPKNWLDSVDLEAGTYYLKVYQAYQDTGKYDLSVKYDQAPNNETEPNNGTLQAQELPFNTQNMQKVTGFISWNDHADYYKLILPKAGTISVNLESYLNSVYLDLTTSDGQSIWDGEYINDGSPNNPKNWLDSVDLEAGTYYLKVYQAYQDTGKYDLSVKYDQAPNNETEPNNGTLQAQKLSFNTQKVMGFISWNDSADYYKLILPKAGTFSVNLESYLNSVYLDLTDSNGNPIWDREVVYNSSSNNAENWSDSVKLEAGTYYLKVYQTYQDTGKYLLHVDAPFLVPVTPSANNVSTNSTAISGKTSANSTVYIKIGSKTYKTASNSKGEYKVTIPKQTTGIKIYITASNSYGTSQQRTVVVVDRTAPKTPTVYSISSKSRYITGKAEAYSTIIAYVGSKKIGSATTDKNGNFKVKISPVKKGTSIKVDAIDHAGNKSSYKSVTVK